MSLTSLYPQSSYYNGTPLNTYAQQLPGVFQQPQLSNELIGLHGLDSAKQYPMKPNTTVPTFDLDSDHAFILNADANGVISVKILKFKVITEEEYRKAVEAEAPIQLQRSEYNNLLSRMKTMEEELENAKQLIRERDTTTKSAAKSSAAVNDSDVQKRW